MEIIYCANGNQRFAQIAIDAGFRYGAQLPGTVYRAPWFADQDWKKPNRDRYMAALAQHRPHMASVLDWERQEQLPEILAWAEDAAQYVEVVMLIPKVQGGIHQLPRAIGGKSVRLGYSVPTKFGGSQLPAWEFAGWPVHLLGGSPQKQMALIRYFDVRSADGNYHNLKATKFCEYWQAARWIPITPKQDDAPYEAFRRSCENIMAAWRTQLPLDMHAFSCYAENDRCSG